MIIYTHRRLEDLTNRRLEDMTNRRVKDLTKFKYNMILQNDKLLRENFNLRAELMQTKNQESVVRRD